MQESYEKYAQVTIVVILSFLLIGFATPYGEMLISKVFELITK